MDRLSNQAAKRDMMSPEDLPAMVETVTVPLEGEAALACGLKLKLRYLNEGYSSKLERTSITVTLGSDWQELTLDLKTQRRWRDFVIALEEVVTPSRGKKGAPARKGAARFRVEKQPQQHKSVELGQPFALGIHDVARLSDGSTLYATEIGPHVTELSITRMGQHHQLELGELGFGRFHDWLLVRDLGASHPVGVAQLTIKTAPAPEPRLRYGELLELRPGESIVGPDGLHVALGLVRNLQHEPCVEVQLRQGSVGRDSQIYRGRTQELRLGEVYDVRIDDVQAPKGGPVRVRLCISKRSAATFEFGREFCLRNGESARGPDSLVITYPVASHIHFTDGKTEGYLDFEILQAGRLYPLRVTMPIGVQSSHGEWDSYALAVRFDTAASGWALVVDKKTNRRR